MKRVFALVLVGSSLLFSLAACSSTPETADPAEPPAEAPADGTGEAGTTP